MTQTAPLHPDVSAALTRAGVLTAIASLVAQAIDAGSIAQLDVTLDGTSLVPHVHDRERAMNEYPATVQGLFDALGALGSALTKLVETPLPVKAPEMPLPNSAPDAMHLLLGAMRDHQDACILYADASRVARNLEDAQGRVRRECAREIQSQHLRENPGAKPIADTPLDKLAGDHPKYVAHRTEMVDAQNARDLADATKQLSAERVKTARLVATAYLANDSHTASLLDEVAEMRAAEAAGEKPKMRATVEQDTQ